MNKTLFFPSVNVYIEMSLLQTQQIEDDEKHLDVLNLKKSPNKNISEEIEKEDTNSKGDPGEEHLKETDERSGSTLSLKNEASLLKQAIVKKSENEVKRGLWFFVRVFEKKISRFLFFFLFSSHFCYMFLIANSGGI